MGIFFCWDLKNGDRKRLMKNMKNGKKAYGAALVPEFGEF